MNRYLPFKIFIGYDSREAIGFHVLAHSILLNSTIPVSITPIKLTNIKNFYKRKKGKKDSTEFSISRFLTPYLSGYKGYSLFLDCDFIVKGDVADLIKIIVKNPDKTIWCVQHKNYLPKYKKKFLNEKQLPYLRKNWSSFMLFNNKKCKALKPKFVQKVNGLYLHQFKWIKNFNQIGKLPKKWNNLVGEQKILNNFKALHYTSGGPYFKKYRNCDGAKFWFYYKKLMEKGIQ
jgi:lipopolysaccharide biosynthesis glycosyltransferase